MVCARGSSSVCLAVAVCFVALASISTASTATTSSASTDATKDNIDRNSNSAVAPTPVPHNDDSEMTLSNILSNLTYHGGFVAAGVLALSALAAMIMPMFGLRLCSLIGTCDAVYPATSYASGYSNDAAYAGYGQAMYSPSSYQKRSIEYIGPILKALSSAYDKYGKASAVASTKKST
ncbi:uncharacterized protein LOC111056946 [Nilaparvata lugens]|uniref:uncharacterized protein LOC111056946 n=1 Tax=Nilaparvata lugens TaxID=108931 RepID=UPI000B99872C|nr:uncharacterized protein LOC111056946 [Nilaparvata lugens]